MIRPILPALPARLWLPLLFGTAALLAIGLSHNLDVTEFSRLVYQNEQQRLNERLSVEQTRLEVQLGLSNNLQVRRLVSGLTLYSGVRSAMLINHDGQVIAATSRALLGKLWNTPCLRCPKRSVI